jgi:hypothetical protein
MQKCVLTQCGECEGDSELGAQRYARRRGLCDGDGEARFGEESRHRALHKAGCGIAVCRVRIVAV